MLLLAVGLSVASPTEVRTPPYFYCEVSRDVPFGNVTVLQYVNTAGASEPPVTTWFAERATDGTVLLAAWNDRAEMEDGKQGGEIYFGYSPSDSTAQYRVEIGPAGTASGHQGIRSELKTRSANGLVGLRTHWVPVLALLAGGKDLEVRVLDAAENVVRRDRIDAAEFGRSLRIAGEIQPEFQEMIANYRKRCRPSETNGR
jgi:hypothetical protein